MRPQIVRIHPEDNVVVAVQPLAAGSSIEIDGQSVDIVEDVAVGHKVVLADLPEGAHVVKYGFPIGHVTEAVKRGQWLHSHNMRTNLSDILDYRYEPVAAATNGRNRDTTPTFEGYVRANGRVGTRNEIWIINTVGCVNRAAQRIASKANERYGDVIDGVHAFSHPYGCSQLGDDLKYTQKVLAGLARHPNAGGVLVLGLGCENNQMQYLLEEVGEVDRDRIRFFNSQDVMDEIEEGMDAIEELVSVMRHDRRTTRPMSDLVLGLKCGGSDAFSGISANPLLGRIADRLTALGGTAILTEVPEMFGAEQILMNRATNEAVFDEIVRMINEFKEYFIRHDQPIYENPSPGNKAGGLTTLEEKSLGATQKGGQAIVTQVLGYGEPVRPGGLALLQAPGNDGVSVTAEIVSGATLVLFTTGRGTPLGFPVPTLKIATNTEISEKKPHWIDFNAGALLDGDATLDSLADDLFDLIARSASGEMRARNEENDYREIAIWKEGVTL
jgi:altronate hydrolase